MGTATVTVNNVPSYTGNAVEPTDITVKVGDKTLTVDTDYEISYANNTGVGTGTLTITGKGNYTGTATAEFDITGYISGATGTVNDKHVYEDRAVEPTDITLEFYGSQLVQGTDFEITSYADNNSAGTGKVTVTGIGNYIGTNTIEFEIHDLGEVGIIIPEINKSEINVNDTFTYNGTSKELKPTVVYTYRNTETGYKQDITLVEGTHYTLSYSNNVNAGDATVTVTAVEGNATGSNKKTFTINQADMSSVIYDTDWANEFVEKYINGCYYTGSPIEPEIGNKALKLENYYLIEDVDFEVEYVDNVEVGWATVNLNGKGNFTGQISVGFDIITNPITAEATTVTIEDKTYTGSELKPEVEVKYGDTVLVKDTDYTVTYSDNVNAGKGKVTVTGKGKYSGSITVEFTINRINADRITIAPIANQKYTGQAITPNIEATR